MDISFNAAPLLVTGSETDDFALSWGQKGIWGSFIDQQDAPIVTLKARLHEPVQMSKARARVRRLVEQHPSLRTLYAEPKSGQEWPSQRVAASGFIPIMTADAAVADIHTTEIRLRELLASVPFHDRDALPLRCGFVLVQGMVASIVIAIDHLSADGAAARLVRETLASDVLAEAGSPRSTASMWDRVQWELSPSGADLNNRAASYWRRTLSEAVTTDWRRSAPLSGRHIRAFLRSPRLTDALSVLQKDHATPSSTLVLNTMAQEINASVASPIEAIELFLSNRNRSNESLVGCIAQSGLVAPTRATGNMVADANQAFIRTVKAMRASVYDPAQIWAEAGGKNQLNGAVSLGFNDLRTKHETQQSSRPPDNLASATTVSADHDQEGYAGRFVATMMQSKQGTYINLMAPEAEMPFARLENILMTVEDRIVHLADTVS
jgi:hypothetical protein